MKKKYAHLVGIKGVAMAALAVYLVESGYRVSGSDVCEEFPTDEELRKIGVKVYCGFDARRIEKMRPDVVYYTGAHGGRDNPEVRAARSLDIPVFPHGKALGDVAYRKRQIVVAGSHGKTTTSAMIATILMHAGIDPSYAIGCGAISSRFMAGHRGRSRWFVAEGDEYVTDPHHDKTPRFLWLKPEILVITNVDFDHPDVYADLSAVQLAFSSLTKQSETVIVNADDGNSRFVSRERITFGFSPSADYRIKHVGVGQERMFFTLSQDGVDIGEFTIKVPGRQYVADAAAAVVAAHNAGIKWEAIRDGLLTFTGTKRRFEKLGEYRGSVVYDDYAHHPAEITATLAAARLWYPKQRIIAVFQPHTYSRTKSLLPLFARAFGDADLVILTDIYSSARENDTLGIKGETLVEKTANNHPCVYYGKTFEDATAIINREVRPHDIVILMGAGSIYTWGRKLVKMV